MKTSTRTLLTAADLEAIEEKGRRDEAWLDRMVATKPPEEWEQACAKWWETNVERPRAKRRVATARKPTPSVAPPSQPERSRRRPREHAARSTAPTRGSPDDDPHLEDPLAAELQAASDALIASWPRLDKQLRLDVDGWWPR